MEKLQKLKTHRKKILKLSATTCVLVLSIIDPILESKEPNDLHGALFLASILLIISAAVIELREEIERKRIDTIQVFYPLQRLAIITFADSFYFIMIPMIVFAFISTVFF